MKISLNFKVNSPDILGEFNAIFKGILSKILREFHIYFYQFLRELRLMVKKSSHNFQGNLTAF